jgi:hypothetical protein
MCNLASPAEKICGVGYRLAGLSRIEKAVTFLFVEESLQIGNWEITQVGCKAKNLVLDLSVF